MDANLYSKRPNLIMGFHGCDHSVMETVLNGAELKKSTNNYDWLGEGIYFWQNSKERAIQYAKEAQKRSNSNITEPAVIGAVIDLGSCLDLLDCEYLDVVKSAYNNLILDSNRTIPKNTNKENDIFMLRYLDKAVIQMVDTMRKLQYKRLIELESRIRTLLFLAQHEESNFKIIMNCISDILDIQKDDKENILITKERKNAIFHLFSDSQPGINKANYIKILSSMADDIREKSNLYMPYDSVRSTFIEGEELYPDAGFREKNHIQICIRNTNCIKGYFLPKDMDECYPNP